MLQCGVVCKNSPKNQLFASLMKKRKIKMAKSDIFLQAKE
uniref:Uncharacterized protein n=1 Tax=Rhizophora mucronata TaxID=61149 RepID=A0A2P2NL56_RHIMU